jgi:hypothetical protein
MGFRIYYRSTRQVSPGEAIDIRRDAKHAGAGRTWLSCEPVQFFEEDPDDGGRLFGGSKPNFSPHPDDAASAAREGLPDGDVRALFEILCQLSRDHGLDWEISHTHEDGPVGYIRDGVCDPRLRDLSEAFVGLSGLVGEYERGGLPDEDEGEGPTILRLWCDP